jgi:hypothetical protein
MTTLFDIFPQKLKESVVEARFNKIKQNSNRTAPNAVLKDFAFPRVKKLPLETKRNVLSAVTHFFNVKGITEVEKSEAFKKIIQKAQTFEICTIVFLKQYEAYLENVNSNESKNN